MVRIVRMSMRTWAVLGLGFSTLGCTSSSPAQEVSVEAKAEVPPNPEQKPEQTPVKTLVEPPPPVVVGWSEVVPETPDPTAKRMKELRELATAGKVDEVLAGLPEVLAADLPRHRVELLREEVWAEVRERPEFNALHARTREAYRDVLSTSAPAFVYTRMPEWIDKHTRHLRLPYKDLRIGVYDHARRRFVPMVPPVKRAFSGLLDRERDLAIVARGNLTMKSMWTVQPDRCRAFVFSLSDFGEVAFEARGVCTSGHRDSHGFVLRLGESGPPPLWVERVGVDYHKDEYLEWTDKGHKKVGWDSGGDGREPKYFPFGRPYLSVVEVAEAGYPAEIHADIEYTTNKRFVLGDVTVKLERGHGASFVAASPDPKIFAVVTRAKSFSTDGYEEGTPLPDELQDRHVIDLVDMHRGTVVRLAKGSGYGHVAWAPDGTLLFETPTRVARVPAGSMEPVDDVLPGVHVGTPPFPEEGGV